MMKMMMMMKMRMMMMMMIKSEHTAGCKSKKTPVSPLETWPDSEFAAIAAALRDKLLF